MAELKTKDLNAAQLLEYFNEHVRYEIQMLFHVTSGILARVQLPMMLVHAPIESYAMHLRNLITFLYASGVNPRDTDVRAQDFFFDPQTWVQVRPPLSALLLKAKSELIRRWGI